MFQTFTLDKSLRGPMSPWTKVFLDLCPLDKVVLDNCPLDKCINTVCQIYNLKILCFFYYCTTPPPRADYGSLCWGRWVKLYLSDGFVFYMWSLTHSCWWHAMLFCHYLKLRDVVAVSWWKLREIICCVKLPISRECSPLLHIRNNFSWIRYNYFSKGANLQAWPNIDSFPS